MCVRTNLVAYRAPGDFIPNAVKAEGCVEVMCPLEISWSPGLWEKMTRETPKNQRFFFLKKKRSGSLFHVDATTNGGSDSCGTTLSVERSTGGRDLRFETAIEQTRWREVVG